jgi:hypothetical protein
LVHCHRNFEIGNSAVEQLAHSLLNFDTWLAGARDGLEAIANRQITNIAVADQTGPLSRVFPFAVHRRFLEPFRFTERIRSWRTAIARPIPAPVQQQTVELGFVECD